MLPEALIKICMRIYQCSKKSAEEFLQKNNVKTIKNKYPKGSVVRSLTKLSKTSVDSSSSSSDNKLDIISLS